MELEVKNIGYTYKGKRLLRKVSFQISSTEIIGITGESKSLLLEILDFEKKYSGQIYVDNELVSSKNLREMQKRIAFISQKNIFFRTKVEEEMAYISDIHDYTHPDFVKRMQDSLKLVGLDSTYLSRNIDTLSTSEQILIRIACNLLLNPQIILLDDIFPFFDGSTTKMLLKLLRKLRDSKNKLIILASNDVNLLYEYTDRVLILKNRTLLKIDESTTLFKDVSFLEQNHIDVPYLVQFTNLAKEKKIRLSYHRDILDLIKDVYKHV